MHVIAWQAVPARAVEIDQVGIPRAVIQIHQQRRVAGHDDMIRIAFQSGHEGGLAQGAAKIAQPAVARHGVLADKDLWSFAIVLVEMRGVTHEPFGRVIKVFVHDVRLGCAGVAAEPMVGDTFDVRVFGANLIDEQRPAVGIGGTAVLVADLQVFQVKRRGMAGSGPPCAPGGIGAGVGVLDGVECVLHPLPHLVQRNGFPVRHPDVDTKERLRAEVLRQLQVFVKPETVCGVIAPDVPERCARINVADGLLPVVHPVYRLAFHPAATGKAHERRPQRVKCFGKIRAQTVVLPRLLRQQRDHVEEERACAGRGNLERSLRVAVHGDKLDALVLPIAGDALDFTRRQLVTVGGHESDGKRAGEVLGARGQLERVAVVLDDVHAPVAPVRECERAVHLNAQAPAVDGIERARGINRALALGARGVREFPEFRFVAVLERAVAHQFGVDAAIGGQVDVLEEDSPQRRGDAVGRLACGNRDSRRLGTGHKCSGHKSDRNQGSR